MASDDRDEPSFVTNVERTLDLEERSEVGTLPRPPRLFEDEEEERVEKTLLLVPSEPAPPVVHRPVMHSEVAGQWLAPVPPPGFVPPISSDTDAMPRTELVAPPALLPVPPGPTARRRRRGVAVFLGIVVVAAIAAGAVLARKRAAPRPAPETHEAPSASAPPTTSAPPSAEPIAPATASGAPSPAASAPPAPSGKHARPRRPRHGR